MRTKSGEIGITTLIIMIAVMVFVVGVLFAIFSRVDFLSSKGYQSAKFTEAFASKGVEILEVEAFDGRNGYFSSFAATIKLLPNSDPLDLARMQTIIGTRTSSAALDYRNDTPIHGPSGYITYAKEEFELVESDMYSNALLQVDPGTWVQIDFDLDEDGINDSIRTCRSSDGLCPGLDGVAIIFNISGETDLEFALLNNSVGALVNISGGGLVDMNIQYSPIGDGTYGYVSMKDNKVGFAAYTLTPTGAFRIFKHRQTMENDIDLDNQTDFLVINDTDVLLLPSSEKQSINISLGTDISSLTTLNVDASVNLPSSGTFLGTLEIAGSGFDSQIPEDATFSFTPQNEGEGFFQLEYLITSDFHLDGRIVRGEIVKIYVDSPQRIYENEEVSLTVVDGGVSFPVTAFSGHTIPSLYSVRVFPRTG